MSYAYNEDGVVNEHPIAAMHLKYSEMAQLSVKGGPSRIECTFFRSYLAAPESALIFDRSGDAQMVAKEVLASRLPDGGNS